MVRVRFVCLVVLICSLLASKSAHADTEQARVLDYGVAPDVSGCADAQTFGDLVAEHLGYNPFAMSGSSAATGLVRTRIKSKGAGSAGTIEIFDMGGTLLGSKSLESKSCDDLGSAMSFAVALAIDPTRALSANKSKPTPAPLVIARTPTKQAISDAPVVSPAAPKINPSSQMRVEPQLALGGGVAGFGPAAGVAPAFTVGFGARYGVGSLELEGRYLAPSSENVAGGKITTTTVGGAIVPCAHVGPIFLCGQFFLGALQGSADISNEQGATTLFAQAGVRVGVSIPVMAMLRIEPFADGLVTLTPTTLKFLADPVWSADSFGVVGGIRIVVHFP